MILRNDEKSSLSSFAFRPFYVRHMISPFPRSLQPSSIVFLRLSSPSEGTLRIKGQKETEINLIFCGRLSFRDENV